MRGWNFKKVGHSGCPLPSTATHPTASQNHGITHISAMRPRRWKAIRKPWEELHYFKLGNPSNEAPGTTE
jgi:hypothetical protein